jgi:uncharacterized protein (TIGR02271 family)
MSQFDVRSLTGSTVVDAAGQRVGKVVDVYLDDATETPQWVTVGSPETFIPLAAVRLQGDVLVVDATRDQVATAPRLDDDGHLSAAAEAELHRHYHLPTRPDAMTRSEEHLVAGTPEVEATRVRLRKYVVTETVTVQVPVRREEVRLEHEPVPEAAPGGSVTEVTDAPDEERDMILHAERPVVTTETVPVERVRIGKETVTGTETVSGEVRRERIELEDPDAG